MTIQVEFTDTCFITGSCFVAVEYLDVSEIHGITSGMSSSNVENNSLSV
jgi:hypothetical protein